MLAVVLGRAAGTQSLRQPDSPGATGRKLALLAFPSLLSACAEPSASPELAPCSLSAALTRVWSKPHFPHDVTEAPLKTGSGP